MSENLSAANGAQTTAHRWHPGANDWGGQGGYSRGAKGAKGPWCKSAFQRVLRRCTCTCHACSCANGEHVEIGKDHRAGRSHRLSTAASRLPHSANRANTRILKHSGLHPSDQDRRKTCRMFSRLAREMFALLKNPEDAASERPAAAARANHADPRQSRFRGIKAAGKAPQQLIA